MIDLQFVLMFSIFPVSGLVLVGIAYLLTRGDAATLKRLDEERDRRRA